jgi:hypothetical protein
MNIKKQFKYHTIYETTNVINGKKYIGAHSTNDLNDEYLGSGSLLKRAIKKYSKESFIKRILFVFDTREEMMEKEIELLTEEAINNPNLYNLKGGGLGLVYSDELRAKLSKSATGRKMHPDSVRKSVESRKKNGKLYTGEAHHMYGKGLSLESIEKMRSTLKKKHQEGYDVWNKGLTSYEDADERKKYGRDTSGDKNPSKGSTWFGNDKFKCYVKQGDTILEKRLEENGWVRKPKNFNNLKSVTKNIEEYL